MNFASCRVGGSLELLQPTAGLLVMQLRVQCEPTEALPEMKADEISPSHGMLRTLKLEVCGFGGDGGRQFIGSRQLEGMSGHDRPPVS